MAYISKEEVKERRDAIKKAFPTKEGWKFSVTQQHYSTIRVVIREAPIELIPNGECSTVNHFGLGRNKYPEEIEAVYQKITDIVMRGNHDNSDPMTDYFDVGWYYDLQVGEWDRKFKVSLANNENKKEE